MLALSLALALIGTIGAATGAADKKSDDLKTASPSTSTTVTDETTTSTTATSDSTSSTTATTVKRGTTATTRGAGTTVTTAKPGACEHRAATTPPGPHAAPAIGKYTYTDCATGETATRAVTAGANSGGVTRRVIQNSMGGFELYATTAFSTNGVIQEKAELRAFGQSAQCDWQPDLVEYPGNLAVGTTWSANSTCTLPNGAKLTLTGTRKVTGISTFVVGDTPVTAWIVDDTQNLSTTIQGRPGTVTNKGFHLYDPAHGLVVYEKVTVSGTGLFAVPETTAEGRLLSLTPAAN